MDRRTDRLIAIASVTAVVVVPTVVVTLVSAGTAEPRQPGAGPAPASLPQMRADGEDRSAAATPLTSPAASSPVAGKPSGRPKATPPGGRRPGGKPSPRVPRGYTRVTDVKLSGAANGDYQQATETARVTLVPAFRMDATGTRRTMAGGKLTTLTQRVVISGRSMRTFDGSSWTSTTLDAATYERLRTGSDPRVLTHLVRSAPGGTRSGPDRFGSVKYTAGTRLGLVYGLLPADLVAEARKVLPDGTNVAVSLWADAEHRPSFATLGASAPAAALNGSMTFRDHR
ncbi:hypothetical protein [Actinomadura kijaniata]|uniref:hypothetical protein n=1 Tax=Actinomadura kijaniata TaxID=46161 RepID=UPI000831BEE8|nr:hypothetical protein [Actinomadura kijaniata]